MVRLVTLVCLCVGANAATGQQEEIGCGVNFLQESSELTLLRMPEVALDDEDTGLQPNGTVDVAIVVQPDGEMTHKEKEVTSMLTGEVTPDGGWSLKGEKHEAIVAEQEQPETASAAEVAPDVKAAGDAEDKTAHIQGHPHEKIFGTSDKAKMVMKAKVDGADPSSDRQVRGAAATATGPETRDATESDCQRLAILLLALHVFRALLHCCCGAKIGMIGVALSLLVHSALILTYCQEGLFQEFFASFSNEEGVPGDLCWWCWAVALWMMVSATVLFIDMCWGFKTLHSQ